MKCTKVFILISLVVVTILAGCNSGNRASDSSSHIRPLRDTVGFAQYPWQMDSLMARLDRAGWVRPEGKPWKMAISPHDDYTYVGTLYPEVLSNVKAPTLILVGVAHQAAALGIEGKLVFDTFSHWKGPWKDVPVSAAREELYSLLVDGGYAMISDTLHVLEHSVESMIPFLQYFNRDINIISILVPAMDPDRMEETGRALAGAIEAVAEEHQWEWGTDYAIVVTTDAVHYGNEDWGGADRAYFGCDDVGNHVAGVYEAEIIDNCLDGEVGPENFRRFSEYTLNPDNFREYIWTWCGRYCVPVTLYTAYYLNDAQPLNGELLGYTSSIMQDHIPVDDIGLGRTAIATKCHWVGYAALGYR